MSTDRKCRAKHPRAAEWMHACHFCKLGQTDPAYRSWGDGPVPPPVACPHRGEPTGGRVACASCGGSVRIPLLACAVFGECSFSKPLDGLACCATCEYNPAPASDPWARRVLVPQPPPIDLWPRRKVCVVTVAAGGTGRELLALSRPGLERFARRVGADFRVLDWPGNPAYPCSSKWAIGRAVAQYDRVIHFDADCVLRNGCVNPLDWCAPGELGACDEMALTQIRDEHGRGREAQRFLREHGYPHPTPFPWMLNAGVLVIPHALAWVFLPPEHAFAPIHCAEQDVMNGRLLAEYAAGRLRYRLLDRRANWQAWTDPEFAAAPPDAVLHVSGVPDRRPRLMRLFAD